MFHENCTLAGRQGQGVLEEDSWAIKRRLWRPRFSQDFESRDNWERNLQRVLCVQEESKPKCWQNPWKISTGLLRKYHHPHLIRPMNRGQRSPILCILRKHMQIQATKANQEHIFINLTKRCIPEVWFNHYRFKSQVQQHSSRAWSHQNRNDRLLMKLAWPWHETICGYSFTIKTKRSWIWWEVEETTSSSIWEELQVNNNEENVLSPIHESLTGNKKGCSNPKSAQPDKFWADLQGQNVQWLRLDDWCEGHK